MLPGIFEGRNSRATLPCQPVVGSSQKLPDILPVVTTSTGRRFSLNKGGHGRMIATLLVLIASWWGFTERLHAQTPQRHKLFSELLSAYVHNGVVDYKEMRNDQRLTAYTSLLAAINPDTLQNDAERLAFWINAYNAFTLKVICDNYPVESINDLRFEGASNGSPATSNVWDKKLATVGGRTISLNTIEHEIVRPVFKDARVHFALVCASRSCPPLRAEAYEAATLDRQLDDQGRKFLSDTLWNEFHPTNRRAMLSKIFDWYKTDFGANTEDMLRYIARFLPDSLARQVRYSPGGWKIDYKFYDWSLNRH